MFAQLSRAHSPTLQTRGSVTPPVLRGAQGSGPGAPPGGTKSPRCSAAPLLGLTGAQVLKSSCHCSCFLGTPAPAPCWAPLPSASSQSARGGRQPGHRQPQWEHVPGGPEHMVPGAHPRASTAPDGKHLTRRSQRNKSQRIHSVGHSPAGADKRVL